MTKHGFTLFLSLSAVAIATFRDEQEFCENESCYEREFDKSHFYSNVKHCGEIPLALSHKLLGKMQIWVPTCYFTRWVCFNITSVCFTDTLPLDEVDGNVIRTVKRSVFSESQPSPLKEPLTLVAVSQVNKPIHSSSFTVNLCFTAVKPGDIVAVTLCICNLWNRKIQWC